MPGPSFSSEYGLRSFWRVTLSSCLLSELIGSFISSMSGFTFLAARALTTSVTCFLSSRQWTYVGFGIGRECRTFRGIGRCRMTVLSTRNLRISSDVRPGSGTSSGSLSVTIFMLRESSVVSISLNTISPQS